MLRSQYFFWERVRVTNKRRKMNMDNKRFFGTLKHAYLYNVYLTGAHLVVRLGVVADADNPIEISTIRCC